MSCAARNGHIQAMHYLKEFIFEEFNYDQPLGNASYWGQLEAMELLKSWGACCFGECFCRAAHGGEIEAMKLLKKWADDSNEELDLDEALWKANEGGNVKAMKLLIEWGADEDRFNINIDDLSEEEENEEMRKIWKMINYL